MKISDSCVKLSFLEILGKMLFRKKIVLNTCKCNKITLLGIVTYLHTGIKLKYKEYLIL